jgi:hypothetical protein
MNLYVEGTATRSFRPVTVSQVDPLARFVHPEEGRQHHVVTTTKTITFKRTK